MVASLLFLLCPLEIKITQKEKTQDFLFCHNSEISSDAVGLHSHRTEKNFVLCER